MGSLLTSVPHPMPYQGSKRNLAAQILNYFPRDAARLIEPFVGSAAVSLAALHKGKVSSVILGDADRALIDLWNAIVTNPDELGNKYAALWTEQNGQERTFYDDVRSEFNRAPRADYLLFLLARCVKAAIRYNAKGQFNQSPDNRRKGTRPDTIRKHLLAASSLLASRSQMIASDYRETLQLACPSDIVYLDPPYQGVCQNRDPRYKSKVAFDEFVNVLGDLNRRHISFIVSYDGKTGAKSHGKHLPDTLNLNRLELAAGRSAQATLLGQDASTVESLYLSPALVERLSSSESCSAFVPAQVELLPALATV